MSYASEPLGSKSLARFGMRRGVYDGANKRRFVLSEIAPNGLTLRREFDTKGERDAFALERLNQALGAKACRDGVKWYHNPFPSGSVEAYQWDQGHTKQRTRA